MVATGSGRRALIPRSAMGSVRRGTRLGDDTVSARAVEAKPGGKTGAEDTFGRED
jgi:hypothetical protein